MEHIELFQALENLKKTLTEINSAKDQVESIIQSFGKVQVSIAKYSNSLKPVSTQLNEIISSVVDKQDALSVQASSVLDSVNSALNNNFVQLTQTCDLIKSSFENQTKKISAGFKNTLQDEIVKLNSQNDKLGASVLELVNAGETIKALKSKIEEFGLCVSELKKEITLSQKAQDVEIKKISNKIDNTDSATNAKLLEISSNISDNYGNLISSVDNISTSINKIIQDNSNLSVKVDYLYTIVNDIKSNLSSITSAIRDITKTVTSVASAISDMTKTITSIKKMMIIAILLSIISILMNFI